MGVFVVTLGGVLSVAYLLYLLVAYWPTKPPPDRSVDGIRARVESEHARDNR
ncbi:hypothetical protein [Nocardia sp. alder85J]|uniref:hypothetical protein n=1 Tax=Nocardia sp. alder85J TaxID=2862949 RepID=UPI001CD47542|nr:hypothetical protein [Nocardia sp. alder85J]MCX4095331.1 hypothetical protein [Nocardia sp. alder85J]